MHLPFIWRSIDTSQVCEKLGSMQNGLLKKGHGRLSHSLTVNVDQDHKSKYDRLSNDKQIQVAEYLRRVIYPEIDRLWALTEVEPNDAA